MPVCDIDLPAMDAKQPCLAYRCICCNGIAKRQSLHIRRDGYAKIFQEGRSQVDGLHQRGAALPVCLAARVPDEKWGAGYFIIKRHDYLGPPIMLGEQETMVRIDDQQGV